MRHYNRTLKPAMLARSIPDMSQERLEEARHRERDEAFVRLIAMAIHRGDHLPAGVKRPLRLYG